MMILTVCGDAVIYFSYYLSIYSASTTYIFYIIFIIHKKTHNSPAKSSQKSLTTNQTLLNEVKADITDHYLATYWYLKMIEGSEVLLLWFP